MARTARPKNVAYRAAFGVHLRDLRLSRDTSQESLALESGVSRRYLSGIERGAANPTLDQIARLALALDTQPRDLLPELQGPPESRPSP